MAISARLTSISALIGLLLVVAGCSFDTDGQFVPHTQGVFFLTDTEDGKEKEIVCVRPRESRVETSWKRLPASTAFVAGCGRILWACDPQTGLITGYDCANGDQLQQFSLPDGLMPHSLQPTEDRLFVADSVQGVVLALTHSGKQKARRTCDIGAKVLTAYSGIALVADADGDVLWLNMTDLSLRKENHPGGRPVYATWRHPDRFSVQTRTNSGLAECFYGYQGDSLSRVSVADPKGVYTLYSPYRQQQYGTELTDASAVYRLDNAPVTQTYWGQLYGPLIAVDFFENRTYSIVLADVAPFGIAIDGWGPAGEILPFRETGTRPAIYGSHLYIDGDAAYGNP